MSARKPTALAAVLERVRREVDRELRRRLPSARLEPRLLHAAIRYAVLSGGQRIRPALLILAGLACGAQPSALFPLACAVELIHAYSLVHDDLPAMDDDDLRRGLPTCHRVYGEAVAILVGDGLQALAFEWAASNPSGGAEVVSELARGAGTSGMVGGQAADILAEGRPASVSTVRFIHERKTGALIRACVRMGAIVAGAPRGRLAALTDYAENLGLAYQIVDDLLDVTSTAERIGKRTRKDADRGKATFPRAAGIKNARREAARRVERAKAALARGGLQASPLADLADHILKRIL